MSRIKANAKRAYSGSASDAAQGASILGSLFYLLSSESDDPAQSSLIQDAIKSLMSWINAEGAEVGTGGDGDDMMRRVTHIERQRRLALLKV